MFAYVPLVDDVIAHAGIFPRVNLVIAHAEALPPVGDVTQRGIWRLSEIYHMPGVSS
jgi:hypothetical protein